MRPRSAAPAVLGLLALSLLAATPVPAPTDDPVPGPTPPGETGAEEPVAGPRLHEACTLTGTDGDDTLVGTEGPDVLCGLGGDDRLEGLGGDDVLDGGAGNDLLDGGEGSDTAEYSGSPRGVRVDLEAGTGEGWGADELVEVESVVGSPGNDVLWGSAAPNRLEGGEGVDLLFGRGGDDELAGGSGDDHLDGGAGTDELDGGEGTNTCRRPPSGASCRSTFPRDGADTRGRLDVRRARAAPTRPVWRIVTHRRWSTRHVWDRGFFLVLLDTRGSPEPDQYAMVRAERRGVKAELYRDRGGRDRLMGSVPARSSSGKRVIVRIPPAASCWGRTGPTIGGPCSPSTRARPAPGCASTPSPGTT